MRWIALALIIPLFLWNQSAVADPFFWGVASSAFQVEGHPKDSDWRRWTHTPGKIKDGTNADLVSDFWNRYDEDFALAQDLGVNAYRISVAWERIETQPGVYDFKALAHYQKMILSMRKRGMEPVITLQHFVLPGWLADQGGLLAPGFAESFRNFSALVFQALAPAPYSVRYWITLNEPNVLALASYFGGVFPPGKNNGGLSARAQAALAKAHIFATIRLRELWSRNQNWAQPKIGLALNWVHLEPKNPNFQDQLFTSIGQKNYNETFVNAVLTGNLEFGHILLGGKVSQKVSLPPNYVGLDYLGLNYYFREQVYAQPWPPFYGHGPGPADKTDLGWEIFPQGLEAGLKKAHTLWKLPLLISENGIADQNDTRRASFLDSHLKAMNRAMASGVPVIGYLHWSLTDNFEWAEGLNQRFGLVAVNYSTLQKTRRPSFEFYKQWIARAKAH